MSEQINLNKDSGERDFGPFSSDGRDDVSPAMKAAIESLKTMEFPQNDDSADGDKEKQEQSQDTLPSDEQTKH